MIQDEFIQGMTCSVCHSDRCIFAKPDYDYKCTDCGHLGYWGQEELRGKKPVKIEDEDDEPPFVSHATAYVLADPKYKDVKYIEDANKLVEKLKGTDYFGDVDESFFEDDTSAPMRGTEEYRQWYDYCMAKGWYGVVGTSPVPEGY